MSAKKIFDFFKKVVPDKEKDSGKNQNVSAVQIEKEMEEANGEIILDLSKQPNTSNKEKEKLNAKTQDHGGNSNLTDILDLPQSPTESDDEVIVPRARKRRRINSFDSEPDITDGIIDVSDTEKNKSTEAEQKKRKSQKAAKRVITAQQLSKFPWLEKTTDGIGKCRCCAKNFSPFASTAYFSRHEKSANHTTKSAAIKGSQEINFEKPPRTSLDTLTRIACLKIIFFLAEHNLPFNVLHHFANLCKEIFPDSKIASKLSIYRQKGVAILKQIISVEVLKEIVRDLNGSFYSISIDEVTDITTKKVLAVTVRYFKGLKIVDRLLGLIEVDDATAEGIYTSIKQFFLFNGISFDKLIGFASDNASVMQGRLNGVATLLKRDYPHIFIIGCTCHSLHLCASSAAKAIPKEIFEFIKDAVRFFKNSSKRLGALKIIQEAMEVAAHKLLKLCPTRWLSLDQVVARFLEQWDALKEFFDKEDDPPSFVVCFRYAHFKMYITFLNYILPQVSILNRQFQSETPMLPALRRTIIYTIDPAYTRVTETSATVIDI